MNPALSPASPSRGGLLTAALAGAIDYAGLFPPASLDIETAIRNYEGYRAEPNAALLGRFVAPATRLQELDAVLAAGHSSAIRVSAVLSPSFQADLDAVSSFNSARGRAAAVDSVEAKLDRPSAIYELAAAVGSTCEVFVELPLIGVLETLVDAVRAAGVCAKVRTGGVTADAIPPSSDVVRFMRTCIDAGVRFKATAGLHHPRTGAYRLTYAPDSPHGVMFGFLNVLFSAAFIRAGLSDADAAELLDDQDPSAFTITPDGVRWRERFLTASDLVTMHAASFGSFGSCSFREPVDELRALSLLA